MVHWRQFWRFNLIKNQTRQSFSFHESLFVFFLFARLSFLDFFLLLLLFFLFFFLLIPSSGETVVDSLSRLYLYLNEKDFYYSIQFQNSNCNELREAILYETTDSWQNAYRVNEKTNLRKKTNTYLSFFLFLFFSDFKIKNSISKFKR